MMHRVSRNGTEERSAEAIIIGGGISGIGAVIKLREQGIDDVLVLEKSMRLGGTWRDNTYPGCACDIPSAIYSYSFAPNPDWSRVFAPQAEIQEYVLDVAGRHGVPDRVRFGTEVLNARWQQAEQHWLVETNQGEFTAPILILAAGPLHEPVLPDVPGIDSFEGKMFHSSRWDHEHDLTGERVAVIGTGASAVQFVPRIRRYAGKLTIFQRTPSWVMPKSDWRVSRIERALFRRIPALQRLVRRGIWAGLDLMIMVTHHPRLSRQFERIAKWNIRRAIKDPELRRALTPSYTLACKRVLISNDFYPALAEPNVELVPSAVREIRPRSVVDANGTEHEVDTIIFGTGFHVQDLPVAERIRDADGRSLTEAWEGSPRAYLGTTIAGYPNLFMLFGPNIGTASAFVMVESQLNYVASAIATMRAERLTSVEVKRDVYNAYNDRVRKKLAGTVWNAGGCRSYYLDANGFNASAWPGTMLSMRRQVRRFDPDHYVLRRGADVAAPQSPPDKVTV